MSIINNASVGQAGYLLCFSRFANPNCFILSTRERERRRKYKKQRRKRDEHFHKHVDVYVRM